MPVDDLRLPLVVILLLLGTLGWLAGGTFFRRLRTQHPAVWRRLGSPSLVLNATIKNQFAIARFVWSSEHRNLNDPRLTRLVLVLRLLGALIGTVFLVGSLALIVLGAHQR